MQSEANLAQRLAYERARRGWSLDTVAKRMTDAGCPIQPSAIYKVEREGRRVVVDELVAFSKVFAVDVNDLLAPVELVLDKRLTALVTELGKHVVFASQLAATIAEAEQNVRDYVGDHPQVRDSAASLLSAVFSAVNATNPATEAKRVLGSSKPRKEGKRS